MTQPANSDDLYSNCQRKTVSGTRSVEAYESKPSALRHSCRASAQCRN